MRFTRRCRALAALAALLAGFGVLVDAVGPLVGAAALGAWLLARQFVFFSRLRALDSDLSVARTLSPEQVRKGTAVTLGTVAQLRAPSDLGVRVETTLPVGVEGDMPALDLSGGTRAATSAELTPAFAGRHEFDRARVHATSPDGLFEETLPVGEPMTLTVDAQPARNIHLGTGGDRITAAYGEHPGGRGGTEVDPTELRKYIPGDPAGQIDWKATARQGELYTKELESSVVRRTFLLLDHRMSTATGEADATELDYLREIGLAIADAAESWNDPLGYYAVGNEGLTAELTPATRPERYRTIRERLRDVRPTRNNTGEGPSVDPVARNKQATALTGDDSAFARTLRPFFAGGEGYARRVEGRPLFSAGQQIQRLHGQRWSVLLTDDTNRAEIRETVNTLRHNDNHVLCVLAPSVLFESGGLADIEDAYRRYSEFESFRRNLASMERVQALEVAPGERLDAVLASREET